MRNTTKKEDAEVAVMVVAEIVVVKTIIKRDNK